MVALSTHGLPYTIEEVAVNERRELDSIKIKYNEDINTLIGSSNADGPIFTFKIVI